MTAPNWTRKPIIWVGKEKHLKRLPAWLEGRVVSKAVAVEHRDTGAISIALFDGRSEAGLIRCADETTAEAVEAALAPFGIAVSHAVGGDIVDANFARRDIAELQRIKTWRKPK